MSEDLKRNNGFIPGVKPGQPTADFIGAIMDKITLPGAVFLSYCRYSSGLCTKAWCNPGLQHILWRNFTINYGRCNS